jgi:hypothetical protein
MSRELQLLRRALADPDFTSAASRAGNDSAYFQYFSVSLPPNKFRGLPTSWDFAVLRKLDRIPELEVILKDAENIAQKAIQREKNETRLIFLSDDPRLSLHDELFFADYLIFCIDGKDLPSLSKLPSQTYLAPLFLAIRRILKSNELLSLFLNPYMRNKPVTGWRFYGRRKELDRLISSEENFIVVGGRRIGKTSLMREAHRRLCERKQSAYFISAEACRTAGDVVKELIKAISPRDATAAVRKSKALDERLLLSLLKQITSPSSPAIIFIDELGMVLTNRSSGDDWGFLGTLRQLSQHGRLRVIFSCFQEMFLSQQTEFEGPLINFGTTMRLSVFADAEVEDLLFAPLELWRPAGEDRKAIRDLVLTGVGRHPLLLQYFCHALFERIATGGERRILEDAQRILGRDLVDCFSEPAIEVFWRLGSPMLCYLFLRHCIEAESSRRSLIAAEMNDDWLIETLRVIGFKAGILDRRTILEALEVRGLTYRAEQSSGDRQLISCPAIFKFIKATQGDLPRTVGKFLAEIPNEAGKWNLSSTNE